MIFIFLFILFDTIKLRMIRISLNRDSRTFKELRAQYCHMIGLANLRKLEICQCIIYCKGMLNRIATVATIALRVLLIQNDFFSFRFLIPISTLLCYVHQMYALLQSITSSQFPILVFKRIKSVELCFCSSWIGHKKWQSSIDVRGDGRPSRHGVVRIKREHIHSNTHTNSQPFTHSFTLIKHNKVKL